MAITNAQQYQQLVNPPMKGKKRPGYRGDDAAKADRARSGGQNTSRADERGSVDRSRTTREQDANQRNVVREGRIREAEKLINRPTVRERISRGLTNLRNRNIKKFIDRSIRKDLYRSGFVPNAFMGINLPTTLGIASETGYSLFGPEVDLFDEDSKREIASTLTTTGGSLTKPQSKALESFGENIANRDELLEKGMTQKRFEELYPKPTVDDRDGPQDPCRGPNPPAYCFVGIRSAAPVVEEEPEYVNPLSKLTPRIAGTQFAAEGGRIGLKSGSVLESLGFTPEHSAAVDAMDKNFTGSQFDYAAASTKDMVDRASNPLTSVASAVGNVVGRPVYDFVDAAQKYSDKGYQGEFGLSPQGAIDFGKNMLSLGGQFLDEKPVTMMAGALKGGIQSLGTKLGEGIYDVFDTSAKADDEDFDMKTMLAKEAQSKKQKLQTETFKKVKEAQLAREAAAAREAAQRQATTSMAEQNRQRGRGGYQSDFAQDKGFMGGSGTAAEMGSFAEGGIASLDDMDREGFLLGGIAKGLKKAVRGVKKLAKSPIGKAALGFAAFQYGGGLGGIMDKFNSLSKLQKFGVGIGVPSILAGLMTPKQDEDKFDIDAYYAANQLNPSQSIRGMGSEFDFYGGQRIASAEGGATEKKEPVAKKVMPLIDMDGKEKDYRETGGFVDMGRMEKADDVPARLSKNEFVFTADAVRNAGDGSIDKGSEVMYNMMKNLESGGDVSEESQGLDGARKMFQTSQRLEEVL